MYAQTILPALALVSAAAAQSATGCSASTITINSPADATGLASCSSVPGTILVGPQASGVISLDGPTTVSGDVICENAGGLTSLSSSSITNIGGVFSLSNLILLSTLSMPSLASTKALNWSSLNALDSVNFKGISKAETVLITNTFLGKLDGINLTTVSTLDINNNNRLTTFNSPLINVTGSLSIDSNGQGLDASFPNLVWAANATFRNCSSVSIPSLTTVNGSLGFYGNNFQNVSAPNLTSVGTKTTGTNGGGFAFVNNGNLANITFPELKSVAGGTLIANNTALQGIALEALSTVGGAVDFSGNFSSVSLPGLTLVNGGFNLQTTAQIDCSPFTAQQNKKIILGKFTCITTSNAKSGVGSATSSGSGSSSTSKAAAASYGINDAVAGISFVGGLLQMLL